MHFILFLLSAALTFGAQAHAAEPKVVTTISPLHSLTAAIMDGAGTPTLLIRAGISPHAFTLRPSDAKAIEEAQVVFWFGESLTPGLARAIRALPRGEVVSLLETERLTLLPYRKGGPWDSEPEENEAHRHDHGHDGNDPHIWLDPRNAAAIAARIAAVLSGIYPDHAETFAANAAALSGELEKLERDIASRLTAIGNAPYLVFHDAYQYFENRFALHPVGSITVNPARAPGAQRLLELRARLTESGAHCVFREPQFEPAAVKTVVEGTRTKIGVLDPLGAEIEPGPNAYFALMQQLADNLTGCLTAP